MQALKKLVIEGWPRNYKDVPPAVREDFAIRDELIIDVMV